MRFNVLLVLLILATLCLVQAQVSIDDCCLKSVGRLDRRVQRRAVKYRLQELDGGCNIRSVIFTMKRGREYCTDPRDGWVKALMKAVDQKQTHNQKKDSKTHSSRFYG